VKQYGSAAYAFGDLYEDIRLVEVTLHTRIREALQEEFGKKEDGWWRKGLPVNVRKKLVERREEDEHPASHAYEYTDIVDLANILDRNWSTIATKVVGSLHDKRSTLTDLHDLNRIRRKVMHPVRSTLPAEEEFEFTRRMRRRFQIEH
jgi:Swt1-like HEPN